MQIHTPEAIARANKDLGVPNPDLLSLWEHYAGSLEDWSHPWLARWGADSGFCAMDPSTLRLEARSGHFDHAPYALASCMGTEAVPTPFEGADGTVYLVVHSEEYKAFRIAQDVASQVGELLAKGSRSMRVGAWKEWGDRICGVRDGLACHDHANFSKERGAALLETAWGCLKAILGSGRKPCRLPGPAVVEYRGLDYPDPSLGETLRAQVERLRELQPVAQGLRKRLPKVWAKAEAERAARIAAMLASA